MIFKPFGFGRHSGETPSAGEQPADGTKSVAPETAGDEEPSSASHEIETLNQELQKAQTQLGETHDRMLRIAADFDNAKKRWERERQEVRLYAIQEFARDLLPVIDAFDKALDAASKATGNPESEEGQQLAAISEGVVLVSRMFQETLKKHGVERLPGRGEAFDPSYHNAIAREVDPTVQRDTVLDEFVPGYRINDRVLRTALVRVAVPE